MNIKRYILNATDSIESENGAWVKVEDVAKLAQGNVNLGMHIINLEARVARAEIIAQQYKSDNVPYVKSLRSLNRKFTACNSEQAAEINRLRAELESRKREWANHISRLQSQNAEITALHNDALKEYQALQDKFVSRNEFDSYITDENKKYDSLDATISAARESLYPRIIYGCTELGRTERISQWVPVK